MFLILGKNGRGEAIVLGTEKTETLGQEFARQAVAAGKVSEVYVLATSAVYFASEINRANPDSDNSLAEKPAEDLGAGAKGINATGIDKRKPVTNESAKEEVNLAQATGKEELPKGTVKPAK